MYFSHILHWRPNLLFYQLVSSLSKPCLSYWCHLHSHHLDIFSSSSQSGQSLPQVLPFISSWQPGSSPSAPILRQLSCRPFRQQGGNVSEDDDEDENVLEAADILASHRLRWFFFPGPAVTPLLHGPDATWHRTTPHSTLNQQQPIWHCFQSAQPSSEVRILIFFAAWQLNKVFKSYRCTDCEFFLHMLVPLVKSRWPLIMNKLAKTLSDHLKLWLGVYNKYDLCCC